MPALALAIGTALGMRGRRVITAHDTRVTSPLLSRGIAAGALAAGAQVHEAGLAPTPALAWATRDYSGGCMVTASHNPEPDNGFKIFSPDGSSLTRDQQQAFSDAMEKPVYAAWNVQGEAAPACILPSYCHAVASAREVNEGAPVVLDCGNGAGSVASPAILSSLGMRVQGLACSPQPYFSRPSEPLPENLVHLGEMVRRTGAAAGIAHDGDADRMVGCDRSGQFISGDRLLVLFARYLGVKRVVTTYDATMAIDEEDFSVRRTPVGDAYVAEELLRWGDFGGEPSGAWIFPRHSLCPDGPYAAALFCEMVTSMDITAELAAIPDYPVMRDSLPLPDPDGTLRRLGAEVPTDGVRISEEEGWCLIRASGTEKKVRITAEGKTPRIAKQMRDKGLELVRSAKSA